ncbi:MAG: hypothetical protein J6O40_03795 [Ruminococcus sp.]|nr:hypothetical protein [Ruminococcus sp.]
MAKRNPSMGGLELPEEMDVNQELGKQIIGESFGKSSGQMSNQVNMLASSNFANASSKYDGIEKVENLSKTRARAKREEEQDFMKSIAKKPMVTKRTIDNEPGAKVKIGGKFISVKRLVITCAVVLAVLVSFALFVPPVFVTDVVDSRVTDENIFAYKGINELRVEYADKYSMEDNQALKSEKAENYRVVEIKFHVVNMSVFATRIPQFELMASQSTSPDRIVYVGNDNKHTEIQPFSKGEATVRVLINVENMDNTEFNKIVRGLVFKSVDMDRKVTKSTFCPSIPAIIFVSDDVTLSLDK